MKQNRQLFPFKKPGAAEIKSHGVYTKWESLFINAALALPKYENTPDTVDMLYAEQYLLQNQEIAWGEYMGMIMSLPFVQHNGSGTVYGRPKKIDMIPDPMFRPSVLDKIRGVFGKKLRNVFPCDNFEIMYDTNAATPGGFGARRNRMSIIQESALLCWEIEMSYRNNLMKQNTPLILKYPAGGKLSAANLWEEVQNFRPVVFAEDKADISGMFEYVEPKTPYNGALLDDLDDACRMGFFNLGYPSGTKKAERQGMAETQANLMSDSAMLASFCAPREDAVKRINARFGLDVVFSVRSSPVVDFGIGVNGVEFSAKDGDGDVLAQSVPVL